MGQLQQNLQDDLNTTLRSSVEKRELLKTLITEVKLKKGNDASDEDTLAIIRKFKANAIECGNLSELPYLDLYLPQMMSEQGVRDYVSLIIETEHLTSIKDLGRVMAHIRNGGLGDQVDNKLASQFAKELLSK